MSTPDPIHGTSTTVAPVSVLSLIPDFLRALASAPAASSFLTPSVDAILLAAASFIERGEEGAAALNELTSHIKAMVSAGRDPTAEEWATLKARSDAAHATIQGTPPGES